MPPAGQAGARRPAKATKKPATGYEEGHEGSEDGPRRRPRRSATRREATASTRSAARQGNRGAARSARQDVREDSGERPRRRRRPPRRRRSRPPRRRPRPRRRSGARKKTVICELSGFEVTPERAASCRRRPWSGCATSCSRRSERLLHQSEELAAEAEQLAREREGGDTQFDEESGEGDTVNVERERDLLLSASARQVVEEIDEALVRA